MAIEYTPTVVGSGYNLSNLNKNFADIETALADAVSRSGETPNSMSSDFDLDGNDLLNGGLLEAQSIKIAGQILQPGDSLTGGLLINNALSELAAAGLAPTALTNIGAATAEQGALASTALQSETGATAFQTLSVATSKTVPALVQRITIQFRTGSKGGGPYRRVTASDVAGYPASAFFQMADGSYWLLDDDQPDPYQFGAYGDNAHDDYQAFQDWGNFCGLSGSGGFIPNGKFALSQQLLWTIPFDIECDESAILRWTATGGGIKGDFRSHPYGLNRWRLPALLSSAINSTFNIPGYSSAEGWAYDVNSRNGAGVHVVGGSRYTIEVQNMQGWQHAYRAEASNDVTYGTRNVANIEFIVNTVDFCENLFYADAGPVGSGGVVAFHVYANTAWVKRVMLANAQNELVGAGGTIVVGGQVFHNEAGGCSLYSIGANCADFQVDLAWVSAGKAGDSPAGTAANLVCGYVGGDGSSNSLTTDGGTTDGYFRGTGIRGRFGAVMGFPLSAAPYIGGYPSGTFGRVRIKNAGANRFDVVNQDIGVGSAIALSSTQGEANFNGGLGGALMARRQLVSITVPTLGNFGSAIFYFYHQLLSVGRKVPIVITSIDSSMATSKLTFTPGDRVAAGTYGDGVNRQGRIEVINVSGASIPSATYTFWLDIG